MTRKPDTKTPETPPEPDQQQQQIQVFIVPTELWTEIVELLQPMPFNQVHKTLGRLMQLRPRVATVKPDGTATLEPSG